MALIIDLVETPTVLVALVVFLSTVLFVQYILASEWGENWFAGDKNPPPKGPREWPIIGCALSLLGDEPQKIFANMARSYGPIFRTRVGMIPTVVLSDFGLIREAFAKSGDDFADRPRLGVMEYITKGRGIISAHVGDSQREKRRFGLAALRSLGMGKSRLVENIVAELETLTEIFTRREGQPFVPFHDITVSVSNIIAWVVFGKRFHHEDTALKNCLHIFQEGIEMSEASGVIGLIPILQYLPLPIWSKIASNHRKWDSLLAPMKKEALQRPETEEPCFIQMYHEEIRRFNEQESSKTSVSGSSESTGNGFAKTKENNTFFNQDDLKQTIGDLFVAGTHTTATTLKWGILYLILHTDIQSKIHEELDRVIGMDRMPTLQDRKDLPYTGAALYEIQRMATIVPLSVPHGTAYDTKLAGYDIPAGTLILPNLWAVHYDPRVWKDPDKFMPERFMSEDGSALIEREELIPFCIGRRKCLGDQLAKMELFLFFTHLLHRFEFRLPEGAPLPSTVGKTGMTREPMPYNVCAICRETRA